MLLPLPWPPWIVVPRTRTTAAAAAAGRHCCLLLPPAFNPHAPSFFAQSPPAPSSAFPLFRPVGGAVLDWWLDRRSVRARPAAASAKAANFLSRLQAEAGNNRPYEQGRAAQRHRTHTADPKPARRGPAAAPSLGP
ncbi:hypothetical protein U9M48_020089 [Paspalum notatum var. saurae]|uniref:Uncharacterized protein n=1 Tax=Paspalum notatum var. saurae TaxID=547442 RepID=A0AAQ3TDR1_PASNO